MSKRVFKVGDRVAVYAYDGRYVGKIKNVIEASQFGIELDHGNIYPNMLAHPKQCRLLKKKAHEYLYICYDSSAENEICGNVAVYKVEQKIAPMRSREQLKVRVIGRVG